MGKTTKLRNRLPNKPQPSENLSVEERLSKIENVQANNSSNVLKFAFFFFMGVGLTILLYPEISKTLGGLRETREVLTEKGKSSDAVEIIEEEYSLDDSDDEELIDGDDDSEGLKKKNTTTFQKYSDKTHDDVKAVPLELEKFDSLQDAFSNDDKNVQKDSVKSVPLKFERNDALEGEIDNDEDPNDNAKDTNSAQEQNRRDAKVAEPKFNDKEITDDEKRKVIKELKVKRTEKPNNKKTVKQKKKSQSATQTQTQTAGEQKLPKEVLEFNATIQKGITPKKIFADGRRIPPMELLPQKPNNSSVKVWMFEEFLSEAECDGLIRVHNSHVAEQSKEDPILCFDSVSTLRKHLRSVGKKTLVTPRDFTPGTKCVNATFSLQLKDWLKGNWSYSTAFYPGESRFASVFEHRVKEAMGLQPENGGKFQITSYPKDIGYKSHTDCIEDNEDKRDRVATVLVYLDTVDEGGETSFPELGIWVRPRKARALLWNNMDEKGKCEPMSIHKANKVEKGRKIILQRWYYYKSFYSLGKRPPEPPLPQRTPGQPRVSCDEFEHGSCRWYDEWNFEHMVEYERQKYTLV